MARRPSHAIRVRFPFSGKAQIQKEDNLALCIPNPQLLAPLGKGEKRIDIGGDGPESHNKAII